ncbi:hypothetical protein ACFS6H_16495 [Terrimonas rubra]|uniref:Uncharacterized protein n=1 Tax=Terrimonas rubra TaxID=1035890 RepID=A0ABW6A7P7_9BACT
MKIYQLGHELVAKFTPMDPATQNELQAGAINWYNEQMQQIAHIRVQNEAITKENNENIDNPDYVPKPLLKENIKHKIFKVLDSWWMRYLIAFSYILLVPKLKAIINGETSEKPVDEDDDEVSDYEAFQQFKRFKKSML